MLLEQLRDFEWLNEPEDVSFSEEGMSVTAKKNLISGKIPAKMFMPTTGIFSLFANAAILPWKSNGSFSLPVIWSNAALCCGLMKKTG